MKHIFISGRYGIGKSTLIEKLISLYPEKAIFGFYTKKEPMLSDGISKVYIHDANHSQRSYTADNCIGACSDQGGKANISVFETTGLSMLMKIPAQCLVVMDELGLFETKACTFCSKVLDVLEGGNLVIGAVKGADSSFLHAVKTHPRVALYQMTDENRDTLFDTIIKEMEVSQENEKNS